MFVWAGSNYQFSIMVRGFSFFMLKIQFVNDPPKIPQNTAYINTISKIPSNIFAQYYLKNKLSV